MCNSTLIIFCCNCSSVYGPSLVKWIIIPNSSECSLHHLVQYETWQQTSHVNYPHIFPTKQPEVEISVFLVFQNVICSNTTFRKRHNWHNTTETLNTSGVIQWPPNHPPFFLGNFIIQLTILLSSTIFIVILVANDSNCITHQTH